MSDPPSKIGDWTPTAHVDRLSAAESKAASAALEVRLETANEKLATANQQIETLKGELATSRADNDQLKQRLATTEAALHAAETRATTAETAHRAVEAERVAEKARADGFENDLRIVRATPSPTPQPQHRVVQSTPRGRNWLGAVFGIVLLVVVLGAAAWLLSNQDKWLPQLQNIFNWSAVDVGTDVSGLEDTVADHGRRLDGHDTVDTEFDVRVDTLEVEASKRSCEVEGSIYSEVLGRCALAAPSMVP